MHKVSALPCFVAAGLAIVVLLRSSNEAGRLAAAQNDPKGPTATENQSVSNEKLQRLLTEREDTFRRATTLVRSLYVRGLTPFATVSRSESHLLDAELDLMGDAKLRVEKLKVIVNRRAATEKLVAQRVEVGRAPEFELALAKGMRLEGEIRLERERARAAALAGGLRGLLVEYHQALGELVAFERRKLAVGHAVPSSVHRIEQQALDVALQLAPDRAGRIAVLEQALKVAQQAEKNAQKRAAARMIGKIEVVTFRAARLAARIRLEREKVSGE